MAFLLLSLSLSLSLSLLLSPLLTHSTTLSFFNKCPDTIHPALQPGAGHPVLARGGFELRPGQATSLRLPAGWSGRVWGRQGCRFDPATSAGKCATGDCGGQMYCNGVGGAPPATLVEITLSQAVGAMDFYDVSLVDGYNLPISMTPFHSTAKCATAGCISDLNTVCPAGLAVRDGSSGNRVVGCRSACAAFGAPQYCCTGSFGGPQSCKPTSYSKLFKSACPRAYSYAYDDPTSILTCSSGASYIVTFCPHYH